MSSRSKSLVLVVAATAVIALVGWYTLRDTGEDEQGSDGRLTDQPDLPSDPVPDLPDLSDLPGNPPEDPAPEPKGFFAVFGKVVTSEGDPAEGVGVGVVRIWSGGSDIYRLPEVRTDANGSFRIERVPIGGVVLGIFPDLAPGLDATELRHEPVLLSRTILGPDGGEVDAGVFTLEPPGAIEGVVLDGAGETCARAVVILGRNVAGLGRRQTKTDHEGRFRFEGLPPGEFFVHASHRVLGLDKGWRSKRIDRVSPGTTNLVIELTTPSAVVLRFHHYESPDEPLLVTSGRLYPVGGSVAYRFGEAVNPVPIDRWIMNIEPGTYHLRFTSEGYRAMDLGQVTVLSEQQTILDVVLSPE